MKVEQKLGLKLTLFAAALVRGSQALPLRLWHRPTKAGVLHNLLEWAYIDIEVPEKHKCYNSGFCVIVFLSVYSIRITYLSNALFT